MHHKNSWTKALLLSLVFHIIFLGGLGYLATGMFQTPQMEEYVEIELISDSVTIEQEKSVSVRNEVINLPLPSPQRESQQIVVGVSGTIATATTEGMLGEVNGVKASSGTANEVVGNDSMSDRPSTSSITLPQEKHSISAPRILERIEPNYPEEARRQGIQGIVIVKVEVLESGRAGEPSIKNSSGNASLDNAALSTVKKWRFIPAKDEQTGQAVRCYTVLSIAFQLN